MDYKYLKDFVIVLVVILAIAFGIQNYTLHNKVDKVPQHSKYKGIALSEDLLGKIHNIENTIKDRKDFVFNVIKDPLEQNLIVKTKKDLEKQWREEVENMVRLESTILPQKGKKMASIAHGGKSRLYQVGDVFIKGKIVDIMEGEILYTYQGTTRTMKLQKIPPKPEEISTRVTQNKKREYNW